MTVTAIRLQEFMAFRDTDWLDLRPITLLFGRNSSGKSAILRALLLLRQSLDTPAGGGPLAFSRQEGYDFGDFATLVRDHDTRRQISVWFRCRFALGHPLYEQIVNWRSNHALARSQVGPPVEEFALRLIFGPNRTKGSELVGVDLYWEGRGLLIQASASSPLSPNAPGTGWRFASALMDLQAGGGLQPLSEDEPSDVEWNIWQHTGLVCPQGFLPAVPELQGVARPREPDSYRALREALEFLAEDIRDFLKDIHHLGPLRPPPERHVYLADAQMGRLSYKGFLHHYLAAQDTGHGGLNAINDWLAASDLRVQMRLDEVSKTDHLYKLTLTNLPRMPVFAVNWCEAGFGNTQVLPIVVELLLAPPGSLILLEQPELHLHPRAQAALGDLLILAAQRGVQVVVETHSEHLLLRLRRRLAETVAAAFAPDLQATMQYQVEGDAIRVYYIESVERRHLARGWENTRRYMYWRKQPEYHRVSRVYLILLDKLGELRDLPAGFRDFFSDDLKELLRLDDAIHSIPYEQRHA